jgi:hypothetical protein
MDRDKLFTLSSILPWRAEVRLTNSSFLGFAIARIMIVLFFQPQTKKGKHTHEKSFRSTSYGYAPIAQWAVGSVLGRIR